MHHIQATSCTLSYKLTLLDSEKFWQMEILFSTLLFPATKCQLHYHFYQSALQNLMVHIQFWHCACSQLVFHCHFLCKKNPFASWSVCTPHWCAVRHLLENCTRVTYTNLLLRWFTAEGNQIHRQLSLKTVMTTTNFMDHFHLPAHGDSVA